MVESERPSAYGRIYALVKLIPPGRVATYGQLARLSGCSARQAGYAMAAAPAGIPWHRVINSRGEISVRREGGGGIEQRRSLEKEGLLFDRLGRIDLASLRWEGPGWAWLAANGYEPGEMG